MHLQWLNGEPGSIMNLPPVSVDSTVVPSGQSDKECCGESNIIECDKNKFLVLLCGISSKDLNCVGHIAVRDCSLVVQVLGSIHVWSQPWVIRRKFL